MIDGLTGRGGDSGDDPLGRVDALMDAELRAEQAAYEAMAYVAELRARDLGEVCQELAVRARRVRVWPAGGGPSEDERSAAPVEGTIVAVGDGWFDLDGAVGGERGAAVGPELLVVTGAVRRLLDLGPVPDGAPAGGSRSTSRLPARLTALEVDEAVVRIGLVDGGEVVGRMVAVATDHLVLDTPSGRTFVGIDALSWVARAGSR